MLMILHDSISMAASASRRLRIDSSRQMGVLQPLLQHRVVIEIVVPQRLFDHQQVERVEGGQVVGVPEPVSGVGVATQRDARPAMAHPLEDLHIPARLALELDALVAGGQFPLDDRQATRESRAEFPAKRRRESCRALRRSAGRAKRLRAAPPDPRWRFPAWPWPCGCRAPGRKIRGQSPPCSGDSAASMGPSSWTIAAQALSVDSAEKNGRSPAVHSPQPVSPSDWISASRILRLRVTPKLVSKGRTRGRCSSRRMIASILIGFYVPWDFRPASAGVRGPSSKTPFPSASRTKPSTANPWENAC